MGIDTAAALESVTGAAKGNFTMMDNLGVAMNATTLEAYALLRPYIAYIHVKDALFDGGRVTPAGWGDGNVKEILRGLKESGYQGYLSLEPHLTDFTGFKGLENGETGEKWHMDGQTAWRIALDSLKAMLWELDWQ